MQKIIQNTKEKIYKLLIWSQKYTKTDMIYLAKGGFWLTFGQAISMLAGFILTISFARLLPQETYGTYRYVLSAWGILMIFTLPGMNTSLIRSVSQGIEGSFLSVIKTKIKWSVLGSIASIIIAGYYFFNKDTILSTSFIIIAFFLPLMDPFNTFDAYLNGKKLFKKSSIYRLVIEIISISCIIASLFLTRNILMVVFVYFFSNTILRIIIHEKIIRDLNPNKKEDSQVISYGWHLNNMRVIGTIADYIDNVLIWHFLGAHQVAIYNFAKAPIQQIKQLIQNIQAIAFVKFSQAEKDTLKKTLPEKIAKLIFSTTAIVLIYYFSAPYFYNFIFPQYTNSIGYSRLYSLILITLPLSFMHTSLLAHAQKKYLYFQSILMPLIKIGFFLILIPLYGIWGGIAGILGTSIIQNGLLWIMFKKM